MSLLSVHSFGQEALVLTANLLGFGIRSTDIQKVTEKPKLYLCDDAMGHTFRIYCPFQISLSISV
jgi:hypothetical protein